MDHQSQQDILHHDDHQAQKKPNPQEYKAESQKSCLVRLQILPKGFGLFVKAEGHTIHSVILDEVSGGAVGDATICGHFS